MKATNRDLLSLARFATVIKSLIFVLALALAGAAAAQDQGKMASSFTPEQIKELDERFYDYLLKHPEVLQEMSDKLQAREQKAEDQRMAAAAKAMKSVNSQDHVRGDIQAPVKMIEFSDFECPFCKGFHYSMKPLVDDYVRAGKVAWVYRHFPLDEIHSKARKEAQAAECANEVGGNEAFWKFADRLFEIAPSNNGLDLAELPKVAEFIQLDKAKFETCLSGDDRGGKYAAHIEADQKDGVASGVTGTPYTLIIGPNGEIFPINGAQPYEVVKAIIDAALQQK